MSERLTRVHNPYKYSPNYIINGGFDLDQRNASSSGSPISLTTATTVGGDYGLDRWLYEWDETNVTTTELYRNNFALGQTDIPGNPRKHLRLDITSSSSDGTFCRLKQRIEYVDALSGTVGVSFYAKSNFSFSINVDFIQNFGTGGSPSSPTSISSQSVLCDTTWNRFDFEFTLPSVLGKTLGTNNDDYLEFRILLPDNLSLIFDLANVSITPTIAKPFYEIKRDPGTELCLAQRYFEKSYPLEEAVGNITTNGAIVTRSHGTNHAHYIPFVVSKRSFPTMTAYNPITGSSGTWRELTNNRTLSFSNIGQSSAGYQITSSVDLANLQGHWIADAEL